MGGRAGSRWSRGPGLRVGTGPSAGCCDRRRAAAEPEANPPGILGTGRPLRAPYGPYPTGLRLRRSAHLRPGDRSQRGHVHGNQRLRAPPVPHRRPGPDRLAQRLQGGSSGPRFRAGLRGLARAEPLVPGPRRRATLVSDSHRAGVAHESLPGHGHAGVLRLDRCPAHAGPALPGRGGLGGQRPGGHPEL